RDGGDTTGDDLAAFRQEAGQQAHVLVVDLGRVGAGERAGLAAAVERPAGADRGAAGGRVDFGIGHWWLLLDAQAEILAEFVAGAEFLAVVEAAAAAAFEAPRRLWAAEPALPVVRLARQDGGGGFLDRIDADGHEPQHVLVQPE